MTDDNDNPEPLDQPIGEEMAASVEFTCTLALDNPRGLGARTLYVAGQLLERVRAEGGDLRLTPKQIAWLRRLLARIG